MEHGQEKFPSGESEREKQIIKALAEGDDEFFRDLGGKFVEEESREELMDRARRQDMDDLIEDFQVGTERQLSAGMEKKAEETLNSLYDGLLDESREFYTNVEKGTTQEVFYRTLAENYPSLMIEVSDDAKSRSGKPLEDCLAVKTEPYKTDRGFIAELSRIPAMKVLTFNLIDFPEKVDLGKELEDEGVLPEGTTDRLLAFWYEREIEIRDNADLKIKFNNKLRELDADPISKDELRELILKIVDQEIEKRSGM